MDSTPDDCIQVSLLPGGISALTSINIGTDILSTALGGIIDNITAPIIAALNGGSSQLPDGDNTPLGQVPGIGDLLGGLPGAGGGDTEQDPLTSVLGGALGAILDPTNPQNTIGSAVTSLTGLGQSLLENLLAQAGLGDLVAAGADPIQTGRVLLRFPNDSGNNIADGVSQSGYIVEKCSGTFADTETTYDFEPCFTASLNLVANAPDGQGVALPQQQLVANVVGPVTFEQNGRLIISLRNTNTLTLNATALGLLPTTATIPPAALNFQLVGSPAHGGREFPNR